MVSEPTETVAPAAHLFARRVQSLTQMSQQEVWDEEDLHQFRITLRTLLAWHPLWAITQLSRSGCQHEEYLKKLIGQCNRQRDRDVFAAYLVPLPHSRRLRQQLRQKTAYRKPSMAELSSLLGQVQRQLTTWQLRMTPTLLQEQLALLLQLYLVRTIRLVAKSQQGSLCELHRLRLRLKSLRYLLEILAAVDPQWRPLNMACRSWQERLGQFADLDGLWRWLKRRQEKKLVAILRRRRRLLGQLLRAELGELTQLLGQIDRQALPTREQLAAYFSLQERGAPKPERPSNG